MASECLQLDKLGVHICDNAEEENIAVLRVEYPCIDIFYSKVEEQIDN